MQRLNYLAKGERGNQTRHGDKFFVFCLRGLYFNHIAILFSIYPVMCGNWDAGQGEAGRGLQQLSLSIVRQ